MKTRVVFFGTPDFAEEFLKGLIADSAFEVVAVVAQPDAVVGRNKILTAPPTKLLAFEHGIPVFQPLKMKDSEFLAALKNLKPDSGVIIAFGRILPKDLLALFKFGCVNVHPSLLPKWRGPSPVQAAIAAGDEVSGVSVMLIDEEMDHGPILKQVEVPITHDDTQLSFKKKIVDVGVPALLESLKDLVSGQLIPQEQDHSRATYCKLLTRSDGEINWQEPVRVILRKINAYNPWPGTWSGQLKIFAARESEVVLPPAQVDVNNGRLLVGTGSTAIEITELQPRGGKRMQTADFLRGRPSLDSLLKDL